MIILKSSILRTSIPIPNQRGYTIVFTDQKESQLFYWLFLMNNNSCPIKSFPSFHAYLLVYLLPVNLNSIVVNEWVTLSKRLRTFGTGVLYLQILPASGPALAAPITAWKNLASCLAPKKLFTWPSARACSRLVNWVHLWREATRQRTVYLCHERYFAMQRQVNEPKSKSRSTL